MLAFIFFPSLQFNSLVFGRETSFFLFTMDSSMTLASVKQAARQALHVAQDKLKLAEAAVSSSEYQVCLNPKRKKASMFFFGQAMAAKKKRRPFPRRPMPFFDREKKRKHQGPFLPFDVAFSVLPCSCIILRSFRTEQNKKQTKNS